MGSAARATRHAGFKLIARAWAASVRHAYGTMGSFQAALQNGNRDFTEALGVDGLAGSRDPQKQVSGEEGKKGKEKNG